MLESLFLLGLLVKNLVYFFILKNNFIPKYLFYIIGFVILIISIGIAVFTIDFKGKGIIPMILNIDFFLISFSFLIRFLNKVLSLISNAFDNKVVNPFDIFFDINFKLSHFYILITIIQASIILIYFAKQT
ncbi:hypothetical protein Q765_20855 [Flavobacterium rivuli WB 3.3-2 = DSM 21788]|uniref:Uncharacterized protein n=1 Tax=Flavobacterium rivuli WB 3.3-2 = DSM 21788 TaxID=1121895 RepID=A0A0A2LZC8_9FLAO|nr:hypothetical protein Q765_20855 [Flavobacterium rivuli WB 3.3-2 = DSM 21788]